MKISPITIPNSAFTQKLNQKSNILEASDCEKIRYNPNFSSITFKNLSPKYLKAKQYLNSCEIKSKTETILQRDFDLNKLDGIQEGIKIFKGLNMKEIAFFLLTVREFAAFRGCYNMCSHCYADAKPPIKEKDNYIQRMSWEDFTSITEGIKELNNRLGFYATAPEDNDDAYIAPFHDADCIDIVLKDKLGNEHDFIDISKELSEATGVPVIFDTSGWFLNNRTAQQRAEKFVEYFKRTENFKNIFQFNISFNPFHSANTKSVMLTREGKSEDKAKKLRDLYTTRMANVFYTFSPMLRHKNFNLIIRGFEDGCAELDGFTKSDIQLLFKETMAKLKQLYIEDMNTTKKHIKNKKDMLRKLHEYKKRYIVYTDLNYTERLLKLNNSDNQYLEKTNRILGINNDNIKNLIAPYYEPFRGILDANGDYYLTSYIASYPTEIKLNLSTSDKHTAPIRPNLQENLIVTKNTINNI
ncbi:MAG: hypothetical protein NC408_08810 [Candidatus Gastranaerophilales bacterium]|nr:hypothetical protein [Candidatus Gastranaerophilales bacterium]